MVSKHHACTSFGLKKKVEPALTALRLLKHINVVYIYNITASFYCYVIYMWQSRVEIELYSVAYFECIAAFEALNAVFPLQAGLIRAL